MQSKEIRRTKRAIRKIKRINKENKHLLKWCKFKVKILEEELASKKKWILMQDKLIPDGETLLKVLEQKVTRLAKKKGGEEKWQMKL